VKGNFAYREEECLALYMTGDVETANWRHKPQSVSYFDIAQQVQHIMNKSGVRNSGKKLDHEHLEYGLTLFDENTIEIGKVGKVKSSILKDFGIKQELFYAELNPSLLFKMANPKLVIQEVAKFPEVRRDLSLVLDRQVSFEEIRYLVLSTEKRLIKDIIVFDVYEGENIPKEKKAYAMGFTLQDSSKTLTDEEIDKTMNRLISAFEQKLGAVIRK
jgi:phenylalanyl-tRNA synthetase beta chain